MSSKLGVLLIVSAPSGGGKSTLTRAYVEAARDSDRPASLSVSYTTRDPRPGEVDGVHYHFVSESRFQEMVEAHEFLEHAEVFGRRYGTGRAATQAELDAGRDVILDIDWQGARQVRLAMPEAVGIFILPPSRQALEQRLRERAQDSDEVIARRMAQAADEMAHCDEYDYLLINDDLEVARADFAAIVRAARCRNAIMRRGEGARIAELLANDGGGS
ncbi:guanylate kinase [Algiphilus aromaticivorans]|uniref:guanylate kinase n=1 Tax=Algiphilus aromaticivorans TaxID=382454 RepID=UPI0005C2085A|nr:guanylate kinase [Algiphilus aromaticivorans]